MRGSPCTNCHLDDKTCIITDRASRRRLALKDDLKQVFDSVYPPPTTIDKRPEPACQPTTPSPQLETPGTVMNGADAILHEANKGNNFDAASTEHLGTPKVVIQNHSAVSPQRPQDEERIRGADATTVAVGRTNLDSASSFSQENGNATELPSATAIEVLYSTYAFLTLHGIATLPPHD
ncbi:hypothetical protein NW759_016856, partial [Fusarium solani]